MARPDHPAPCYCPDPSHPAVVRGRALAAASCAVGITNLRRAVAKAEEWKIGNKQDGSRVIEPERAILAGNLRRAEASMAATDV